MYFFNSSDFEDKFNYFYSKGLASIWNLPYFKSWDEIYFTGAWLEDEVTLLGSINKLVPYYVNVFTIDVSDVDGDGRDDDKDNFISCVDSSRVSGVGDVNVSIGNSSDYGESFENVKNISLMDGVRPIIEFSHNFTKSRLNLNNISVVLSGDFLIVNLSQQLQEEFNKTLWIDDNNFKEFCVVDKDISSRDDVSSDCSGDKEFDFTSCLWSSGEVNISGIVCVDHGSRIEVRNLKHSALVGTVDSGDVISSSGDHSSYSGKVYNVEFKENLKEIHLRRKDKVKFNFSGDEFILKVLSVNSNSVLFNFGGLGKNINIYEDEEVFLDLDNDGENDLVLKVKNLMSNYLDLSYGLSLDVNLIPPVENDSVDLEVVDPVVDSIIDEHDENINIENKVTGNALVNEGNTNNNNYYWVIGLVALCVLGVFGLKKYNKF